MLRVMHGSSPDGRKSAETPPFLRSGDRVQSPDWALKFFCLSHTSRGMRRSQSSRIQFSRSKFGWYSATVPLGRRNKPLQRTWAGLTHGIDYVFEHFSGVRVPALTLPATVSGHTYASFACSSSHLLRSSLRVFHDLCFWGCLVLTRWRFSCQRTSS